MNNKINKVYFDMDGVLVDFYQSLLNFTGKTVDQIREDGKKNGIADPIAEVMMATVEKGLFLNAPAMEDFQQLKDIMFLLKEHGVSVEILSSISEIEKKDLIPAQKQAWLENHGISEFKANLVAGWNVKDTYANENCLLIDDMKKCTDSFAKAGGKGLQHVTLKDTVDGLQAYFPEIPFEVVQKVEEKSKNKGFGF